jgi:predicted aldo/keto reductase-like oxidoreductase
MQKRRLGRTNLMVSCIGLGGIPLARIGKGEAVRLVHLAIDSGINFIDTARNYEDSEEKIGEALRERRHEVILATKTLDRSSAGAMDQIETSLRVLGTERIDLFQLHQIFTPSDLEKVMAPHGALAAARQAQEQGKILHIGLSSHNADTALAALKTGEFSSVQVPFNVIENQAQTALIPYAQEQDIGTIAMKPLAGGNLRRASLALRWILQQEISSAIPGMAEEWEVRENCRVGRHPLPLSEGEEEDLVSEAKKIGTRFCRRCAYCMPCPNGINIPLSLSVNFGFAWHGGDLEKARLAYGTFIRKGMTKSAALCAQCKICEEKCPYQLAISDMMQEIAHRMEGIPAT